MKRKIQPTSENSEIIIPEDQVEVIEVSPENIHLESPSSPINQNRASQQARPKNFSFNLHSSGPLKLSFGKFFLGCAFFFLLLLGIFISFVVGITKLLQKLLSMIF